MAIERDVDCGAQYDEKRRELIALVRSLTAEQRGTTVSATPAWSVQDAVAHVVGIAADLNANRFGDGSAEAWTAEQVDARRGRSLDELADEWDNEAPTFVSGLGLFGYEMGSHYVGDLLQHTADIREALDLGPLADDDALHAALDFYLGIFGDALEQAGIGSVTVRVATEQWTLGSGPVVASLDAGAYELFRCLGGRRTEAETRRLGWTGNAELVVGYLNAYPPPTVTA